ncbi:MAG: hypothetical protein EXX96DRAFT_483813 [Benjaminiella poitrasii]|nr:MAG: hypothetical protein EXX96DRAFT_483813 [Benjaminiella poitrasii]
MKSNITYLLILALCILNGAKSLEVKRIEDCPQLVPRNQRPNSVDDLRIDDIEVIAAIGDSITAGMLAKNDSDAPSIARYIKHFNPNVYGASIGQKPARLCPDTFFCLDSHHDPEIDVLNAAQSGATSQELNEQVDYLVERIGQGTALATKWKLINIFVGSNDVSVSCMPGKSAEVFKSNVKSALEKLINNIDYAFINLVGILQNSELTDLVQREAPEYKKNFNNENINLQQYECYCCSQPNGGVTFASQQAELYNEALAQIANELDNSLFQRLLGSLLYGPGKNIVVVYQPIDTLISTIPYTALRFVHRKSRYYSTFTSYSM